MLRDDIQTAEGITYEDVREPLERGEQFVQWAETGAGTAGNALSWGDRSGQVRYNLSQFWSLKGDHYSEDEEAWDKLDLRAHRAWAWLAEMGMVADNPPAQAKYQTEAQQAYAKAAEIAERLDLNSEIYRMNAKHSADFYAQAQRGGVDDRMVTAFKDRISTLVDTASSLLGIPWWAWALGGVALLWTLKGR